MKSLKGLFSSAPARIGFEMWQIAPCTGMRTRTRGICMHLGLHSNQVRHCKKSLLSSAYRANAGRYHQCAAWPLLEGGARHALDFGVLCKRT